MIHLSTIPVENIEKDSDSWQILLKQSRISSEELLAYVGLDSHPLLDAKAEQLFELRVPRPYLNRIKKGDPEDPLLLQVMPQAAEFLDAEGYTDDPLGETDASPTAGLIHKYESRVLLVTTGNCAINCRYCFRRHFPYHEHKSSKTEWRQTLEQIGKMPHVNEVILSGGDPLAMNNSYLRWLLENIDALPNISTIRIHSRLPVVIPQRIDQPLLDMLDQLNNDVVFVTHINHAQEIDDELAEATRALSRRCKLLLNQSVILKSVNDDARSLCELSKSLFEADIQPYYLFGFDRVTGASHFEVELGRARQIYRELLGMLPGYLVPRFVQECPGRSSKTPVDIGLL